MKIIRQIFRPNPKVLYLEPVFGCNYRCIFCIHGSGCQIETTQLDPVLFEKLKPLIEHVQHIHITGLGEPLLNSHLIDYLTYFREKDKSYYINTNGSMITNAHVNLLTTSQSELSISLDAGDGETFRKVRIGGNWQKVLDGIRRVSQAKAAHDSPHPLLYLTFHINGLNVMSLKKVPDLARELKIDAVKFSWTMLPESHRAHSVFAKQDMVAGIIRDVSAKLLKNGIKVKNEAVFDKHLRSCWNFSPMAFIGANGAVAACCSRWLTIGDLNDNSFTDIWNGMPRRRLALAVLNDRPQAVCQDCPQIRGADYVQSREDFLKPADSEEKTWLEKTRCIQKLPRLNGLDRAFGSGIAALLSGNVQSAVDIFSDLDLRFPDFFEIKNNLGVALAHLGRIEECHAVMNALLKIPHYEKMYPRSWYEHRSEENLGCLN
jgi:MoaA/NifB/PqqE/SkfB family radical SAM enzyme